VAGQWNKLLRKDGLSLFRFEITLQKLPPKTDRSCFVTAGRAHGKNSTALLMHLEIIVQGEGATRV